MELRNVKSRFSPLDYTFFILMLLVSFVMGIYFAFRSKIFKSKKKENLQDFLTGVKKMTPLPVSISLIACYISGITMLGTPVEIYNYGFSYTLTLVAIFVSGIIVTFVYMPVFRKLHVASSYEYLEIRFHRSLRALASCFFIFDELVFLPNCLYAPCNVFARVTGLNLHVASVTTCGIVAIYTIIGGYRAVVYTDAWQTAIMFAAQVVIVIMGIVHAQGFKPIFDHNIEGGRIPVPNFVPNMYERFNAWAVFWGGLFYWTGFNAVNQTMVQRYLSLPTDRQAQITVGLFTVGVVFFILMCCFAGLLLYDQYRDCDPLAASEVANTDQMMGLYVLEITSDGIPGIFISGVYGAALSLISIIFNSSAVVFLEDILRGIFHVEINEKMGKVVNIAVIAGMAVTTCGLVPVIEKQEQIFRVAFLLSAIVTGPIFGVFSLGMLTPWANSPGAMAGALGGFIVTGIVAGGNMYVVGEKWVVVPKLTRSIAICEELYNRTGDAAYIEQVTPDDSTIFPLFKLSYLWITVIGVIATMIIGIATSFATGKTDLKTLDPDLISPVFKWILPEEAKIFEGTSVKKVENLRVLEKMGGQAASPED